MNAGTEAAGRGDNVAAGRGAPDQCDARPAGCMARRALVVDDDAVAREVLRRLLQAEGFECDTAACGDEALSCISSAAMQLRSDGHDGVPGDAGADPTGALARFRPGQRASDAAQAGEAASPSPYALIFVDLLMPGLDGIELTRRIRAIDERPAVVVVTGVDDASRAREALRLGADEYVAKPYSMSQIRLAWEQAFERRRQLAERRQADGAGGAPLDTFFHDLRNPLAAARGYLSLMQACPEATGAGDIAAAAEGCDRAIDMIEAAEELGRMERSETPVARTPLALGRIVLEAVGALGPAAERAGRRIRTVYAGNLLAAVGDARLVKRIVSDLLADAIKHASGKADVVIELSTPQDRAEVLMAISDDGPRIPEEHREAVFDKRRQGELRRAAVRRGHGLSLPFAREACRRMGGRIWIEDAEPSMAPSRDGGCRFVVALPAGQSGKDEER